MNEVQRKTERDQLFWRWALVIAAVLWIGSSLWKTLGNLTGWW